MIGARAVLKALLLALLEPTGKLRQMELQQDYTGRLALHEQLLTMPFGTVWDRYCEMQGVPTESCWLQEVRRYEATELGRRK